MENNQNNKFVIRKVPLYSLINLLNSLYEDGADYVDLYREEVNEEQDSITVSVPLTYMSKDSQREEPIGPPSDDPEEGFLNDGDIKNLLDNA